MGARRMTALLSPNRRRLWKPTARQIVDDREGTMRTLQALIGLGWTPYDGPGTADSRGWYRADDPAVVPAPVTPRRIDA